MCKVCVGTGRAACADNARNNARTSKWCQELRNNVMATCRVVLGHSNAGKPRYAVIKVRVALPAFPPGTPNMGVKFPVGKCPFLTPLWLLSLSAKQSESSIRPIGLGRMQIQAFARGIKSRSAAAHLYFQPLLVTFLIAASRAASCLRCL